jgi:hypothetical protein
MSIFLNGVIIAVFLFKNTAEFEMARLAHQSQVSKPRAQTQQ